MQNEKSFLTDGTELHYLIKKAKRSTVMKNVLISLIVSFSLSGFIYWKLCTCLRQGLAKNNEAGEVEKDETI